MRAWTAAGYVIVGSLVLGLWLLVHRIVRDYRIMHDNRSMRKWLG